MIGRRQPEARRTLTWGGESSPLGRGQNRPKWEMVTTADLGRSVSLIVVMSMPVGDPCVGLQIHHPGVDRIW